MSNAVKIETEDSINKEQSNRNDNSGLAPIQPAMHKRIKSDISSNKYEDKIAKNSNTANYIPSQATKSILQLPVGRLRDGRRQVNNIIININNQINNIQTESGTMNIKNARTNTIGNITQLGKRLVNGEQIPGRGSGNFDENDLHNAGGNKFNDKIIDVSQNEFMIKLSRIILSPNWKIYYFVFLAITIPLSLSALAEIFFMYEVMNTIWMFVIDLTVLLNIILDSVCGILLRRNEYLEKFGIIINDVLIAVFSILQFCIFFSNWYSLLPLLSHFFFCCLMSSRFAFGLVIVRNSLKVQKDVMQNIEEIINFTDFPEDPQKNEKKNTRKKYTPAISFIDEDMGKNKKGELNLIKSELKNEMKKTEEM